MNDNKQFNLPDNLNGRSIHAKVIPTVCNLENMLNKLVEVNGDFTRLKQWEKRSYKAYCIEDIKTKLLLADCNDRKDIVRKHIHSHRPSTLGASVVEFIWLRMLLKRLV